MGRYDALYAKLPVWAQNLAVTGYGVYWHWLRFGAGYKRYLAEYLERERYDAAEWRTWQQRRLCSFLATAARAVPYYRDKWDRPQKAAANEGRLAELPLLDKDVVREDPKAFVSDQWRRKAKLVFHTSGSTGTPIATIWTAAEYRDALAVREARSARWAGASFRLPRATFSGRMVEPDPASKGPFYRFNRVERQVYFSAFHLRPDTAKEYVRALRTHRIQWMTGYAVSYYLLARLILEQQLPVPPLRAVVTTSEKVTREMRSVMEAAYGCRVYEEYSTVENALFASDCECSRLHVSPDVGLVEILRPDGSPCAPGEAGEVVTTCLMREAQPFIRYRLGDVAAWDPEPCPCGRQMPVLKEVLGRVEDVVVGPDGRQLVRFHGVFVDQPHVREGQIVQETLTRIRVRVVPTSGFCEDDVGDIRRRVQHRLGTEVDVVVEAVNEIPRTAAGKFKAVVSLLR